MSEGIERTLNALVRYVSYGKPLGMSLLARGSPLADIYCMSTTHVLFLPSEPKLIS